MGIGRREYSPLSPKSKERIRRVWGWYKENIGLEGDLAYNMRREGKSREEIAAAVQQHRSDREVLIEDYRAMKEATK